MASVPFLCSSTNPSLCSLIVCNITSSSTGGSGLFSLLGGANPLGSLGSASSTNFNAGTGLWTSNVIVRYVVVDDVVAQSERTIRLTAMCALNAETTSSSSTIVIIDDDSVPASINFNQILVDSVVQTGNPVSVGEGQTVQLQVAKSGGTSGIDAALTIQYQLVPGSGNIFDTGLPASATTGLLIIPFGSTTTTLSIPIVQDLLREGAENFTIILVSVEPAQYGQVGENSSQQILISSSDQDLEIFGIAPGSESAEVSEGGTVTILVQRSQRMAGATTITYALYNATDDTLISDASDISPISGTLSFGVGDITKGITLTAASDGTPETRRAYRVMLSVGSAQPANPAAIAPAAASAIVSVLANGYSGGAVGVAPSSARVSGTENGFAGHVTVVISREGGTQGIVDGTWHIADSLADIGVTSTRPDFALTSGLFRFVDGATQTMVVIPITDDDIPELAETYYFVIDRVITSSTAVLDPLRDMSELTIEASDDPNGVLGFTVASTTAVEASMGTTPVSFDVARTRGAFGAVTVGWRVLNPLGALADLLDLEGSIVFAAGQRIQTFVIHVAPDELTEPTEAFTVELYNPLGGASINASAAQQILSVLANDDAFSIASASVATVAEEGTTAVVTVNRNGFANNAATLQYAVVSGTATQGSDYNDLGGNSVTFSAGQQTATISIAIVNDAQAEANETFQVMLTAVTSGDGVIISSQVMHCGLWLIIYIWVMRFA